MDPQTQPQLQAPSQQQQLSSLTAVFPTNHTNLWPILNDMWSFFAGNAGNISVLSVNSTKDVIPDLKLAEKVGAKLTMCVPTDERVEYMNDVKSVLKERGKSTILSKDESFPVISKCWVLSNRVSIVKGIPGAFNGSAEIVLQERDLSGNPVDLSGNTAGLSGNTADLLGNTADLSGNTGDLSGNLPKVTVPLIDVFSLTENNYFDIIKIDFLGQERLILSGLLEAGMRSSLILVRWSESPNKDKQTRAAAATLQNHGYTLLSVIDGKYLYYYNDKPFYNLCDWETPSMKNPMVEKIIDFTTKTLERRFAASLEVKQTTESQPQETSESVKSV